MRSFATAFAVSFTCFSALYIFTFSALFAGAISAGAFAATYFENKTK